MHNQTLGEMTNGIRNYAIMVFRENEIKVAYSGKKERQNSKGLVFD